MATYQPMETGFKPEGPLGAWISGQNEANQQLQNRMANLADLFDQRQKDLTYRTGQFDLGEKQYKAPSERLASDVTGRLSRTQLDTPGYFTGRVAGAMGQDQSLAAKGSLDAALLPSATASGIATNVATTAQKGQDAHITALMNVGKALRSGGKGQATQYILNNYSDPKQRQALLGEVENNTIQSSLQHYAYNNPTQLAKMQQTKAEIAGRANAANITAKSYNYAADKNLELALLNQDKLQLDALESKAQRSADLAKQLKANLSANPMWLLKEGKASPEYKAAASAAASAERDATEALTKLLQFVQQPRTGKPSAASSTPAPAAPGSALPPSGTDFVRDPVTGKPVLRERAAPAPASTQPAVAPVQQQSSSFEPQNRQEYRLVQDALLKGYTPVGRGNSMMGSGEIIFEDGKGNRVWSSQLTR